MVAKSKCCCKPTATTSTIYSEEYFAKSTDGLNETSVRNMAISRSSAGIWTATLTTPHPDGVDYHPSFTAEEQDNVRDIPDITIVQGSITATGFQFQITTGDNGGNADLYVDAPFTIGIDSPVTVVTEVN